MLTKKERMSVSLGHGQPSLCILDSECGIGVVLIWDLGFVYVRQSRAGKTLSEA